MFFVGKAGILGSGAGMRDWDKFVPWLGSSAGMEILTRFIPWRTGLGFSPGGVSLEEGVNSEIKMKTS